VFSLVRVTGMATPEDWHNTGLEVMKPLYQRPEIRIAPDPRGTEGPAHVSGRSQRT
jgi:hypothetical protein